MNENVVGRLTRSFWLTGSGLETYRLAQLPFGTEAYARAMDGMIAEDPHSAYLSSLLATGVAATLLYVALLV